MAPHEADKTRAVALCDAEGDGDLDVIAVGDAQDRLFLNEGHGVFRDATSGLPVESTSSYAVVAGDVDGDGDIDAVDGTGELRLLINDGSGSFVDASSNVPEGIGTVRSIALMDLESDTDLDVVVGVWGAPSNQHVNVVLINDGAGVFSLAAHLWHPKDDLVTYALAAGDVDLDADPDLFVGYYADQNVLYLNAGGAALIPSPLGPPAVEYNNTRALALVDLDGDVDLDLVSAHGDFDDDHLFFNDGSDAYWWSSSLEDHESTYGLAPGDLDADGDVDLLLGGIGANALRYMENAGGGPFLEKLGKLPADGDGLSCSAIAAGDLDSDGDLDAWIANVGGVSGGQQDCLYLNDGTGAMVDATGAGVRSSRHTRAFALGDVDGDSDLDLATGAFTGSATSGESRLYLNDGQGELSAAPSALPPTLADTQAMALGDLDGDQDLDLLIGGDGPADPDRLLLNDGHGKYAEVQDAFPAAGSSFPAAIALVDAEGDGDHDAFFGNYKFSPSNLYLNDGAAHFTDGSSLLPFDQDETSAAVVGDVDGDGDLDIATANENGKPRLYVSSGTGSFADGGGQIPTGSEGGRDLVLADVDGDSDLDLVVADSEQDRLLLNDGAGVYQDASTLLPPADSASVDAGDFDHDGDADLVLSEQLQSGNATHVYENDGTGAFQALAPDQPPVEVVRGVAFADLNGDSWLELFTLGYDDRHRVYFNLAGTVTRTGAPRLGKPLGMELHGSPGDPWFLAWSLGAADLQLPPYGVLKLDPATLVLQASGWLDATGSATTSVDVPAIPALTGLAVHWQGLIGEPLFLTALEVTTLTAL